MNAAGSYAGGVILALDSATHTGVCEGAPGEAPRLETIDFGKGGGDEFTKWARAMAWIVHRLKSNAEIERPIKLICIEGIVPQYDKTLQCGFYACLGAVARHKGIPIISAMPQTWRAVVLGDGKLPRKKAKARAMWLATQLGWHADTDDAAEAGCIWLWAIMELAPRQAPRLPLFMRGAA